MTPKLFELSKTQWNTSNKSDSYRIMSCSIGSMPTSAEHKHFRYWTSVVYVMVFFSEMWCGQGKWVVCRALSNFRFEICLLNLWKGFCYVENSIKIWHRDQRPSKDLDTFLFNVQLKTIKYKKEFHTVIGYLKINIPHVRFIPLGHLTNYGEIGCKWTGRFCRVVEHGKFEIDPRVLVVPCNALPCPQVF